MIKVGKYIALAGDFHTHLRWDIANPTTYLSGMSSLGLDFVFFCDGYDTAQAVKEMSLKLNSDIRIFAAWEVMCKFAHLLGTLENPESIAKLNGSDIKAVLGNMRRHCLLNIFAHPAANWSGAYDGTGYAPLAKLYREGLIDAVQITSAKVYREICAAAGKELPTVGGIDCHGVHPLPKPLPEYLFNANVPVLSHIDYCNRNTSVILTEDFSLDAIVEAVKNGRCTSMDLENFSCIGPSDIFAELNKYDFFRHFQERRQRRNAVAPVIPGPFFVGKPFELQIPGAKKLTLGGSTFIRMDGDILQLASLPEFNHCPQEYYPLTAEMPGGTTRILAISVSEPVFAELDALWDGGPQVIAECVNHLETEAEIELTCDGECFKTPQKKTICLRGQEKRRIIFVPDKLPRPGFEYEAVLAVHYGGRRLDFRRRLGFPAALELKPGESPWRRHELPIFLDSVEQVTIYKGNPGESWRGPEDLSAVISLSFDSANLYIYVEVTDDIFHQVWTGKETFWGDSFQFVIDPACSRNPWYGTNFEATVALTPQGSEIWLWNAPSAGQVCRAWDECRADVSRDDQAGKTIYRITLPWLELGMTGQDDFDFMAAINDNDGGEKRRVISYGGNLTLNKDLRQAQRVVLIKAKEINENDLSRSNS